jgi:hypothetical protein
MVFLPAVDSIRLIIFSIRVGIQSAGLQQRGIIIEKIGTRLSRKISFIHRADELWRDAQV